MSHQYLLVRERERERERERDGGGGGGGGGAAGIIIKGIPLKSKQIKQDLSHEKKCCLRIRMQPSKHS